VKSSFATRNRLMRIYLKFIIDHQTEICRVAARDSGKPMVDAAFGEVLTTCEKLRWLYQEGEQWLKPESRRYRNRGPSSVRPSVLAYLLTCLLACLLFFLSL